MQATAETANQARFKILMRMQRRREDMSELQYFMESKLVEARKEAGIE